MKILGQVFQHLIVDLVGAWGGFEGEFFGDMSKVGVCEFYYGLGALREEFVYLVFDFCFVGVVIE